MYWSTKSFHGKTDKNYIVVKHPLRFFGNSFIAGLKFCNGYTVVEKDSKPHRDLKKNPMFKKSQEFGLSFLQKAGFRTRDIELIFGKDIYYHYLEAIGLDSFLKPLPGREQPKIETMPESQAELVEPAVEQTEEVEATEQVAENAVCEQNANEMTIPQLSVEEISAAHKEIGLCSHVKPDNMVCENKSSKGSPSGYCFGHIRHDPELKKDMEE